MSKLQHQLKSAAIFSMLIVGFLSSIQNAMALDAPGEGRRAWLKYNCYGCHGMRAAGGMGPKLAGKGEDVLEAVFHGEGGGMPSYNKYGITSTDAYNLTRYLNLINLKKPPQNNTGEPYFMHWWEATPSK